MTHQFTKIKLLPVTLAVCLVILLCSNTNNAPLNAGSTYVSDYENVLGTSLQIKVSAANRDVADQAEAKALNEIDRLDQILSGYNAQSEFSRWMNGPKKATVISPELFQVLDLFDKWRKRTNGALDPSAEVVTKLWKSAAKEKRVPTQTEIDQAVEIVHHKHYMLKAENSTVQRLDDAPLILNSFAKSYIINKACDAALGLNGVTAIVLNIGGDIVIRGNHTEQVQISDPRADAENDAAIAKVALSNKAIATSGNYRRGELINGKWYSHIVDPRTGTPAETVISSTVVADNAADAGALATAFSVLKHAESAKLAATIPGVQYLIFTNKGERIESNGWKALELPIDKPAPAVTDSKANTWDPNNELAINIELAEIQGFRVHRPYVAVWVVDKNNKPVRNIALWYNKTRYLDEMRAWYRTYYQSLMDANASVSSTSSATRSPGKYTLKWDGKDDNGKLVSRDSYTIYIEAAREHGTYQLMEQKMDFAGGFKQIQLTGNTEIAAAILDYRKKPKDAQ
jgi:thiamine biosynthesis lipoprotein